MLYSNNCTSGGSSVKLLNHADDTIPSTFKFLGTTFYRDLKRKSLWMFNLPQELLITFSAIVSDWLGSATREDEARLLLLLL